MKLLIVDDSLAVSGRLLEMMCGVVHLTALSFARSLREAGQKCLDYCPDMAVVEMNLPDGHGLDALSVIKRICPHTQVFMFSNQIEFRGRAMLAGADGFYDRSLEFEALVNRLQGDVQGGVQVDAAKPAGQPGKNL